MNLVSRTITGSVLLLVGIGLVIVSFFTTLFLLIYTIPLLIIGLVILLNKKEDEIEERKDLNKIKTKK